MSRTTVVVISVVLFLGAASIAPAPIIENPAPTSAPAKPKRQAAPKQNDKPSSGIEKFTGTWSVTVTERTEASTATIEKTLVIQSKSAAFTSIVTNVLTGGEYWNALPEDYNTVRQFSLKYAWSSTALSVTGAALQIQWPAGQFVDWSPKAIPFNAIQSVVASFPSSVTTFTLRGDQLDQAGGPTFHRSRGLRK